MATIAVGELLAGLTSRRQAHRPSQDWRRYLEVTRQSSPHLDERPYRRTLSSVFSWADLGKVLEISSRPTVRHGLGLVTIGWVARLNVNLDGWSRAVHILSGGLFQSIFPRAADQTALSSCPITRCLARYLNSWECSSSLSIEVLPSKTRPASPVQVTGRLVSALDEADKPQYLETKSKQKKKTKNKRERRRIQHLLLLFCCLLCPPRVDDAIILHLLRISTTARIQSPPCISSNAVLISASGLRCVMNSSTLSRPSR